MRTERIVKELKRHLKTIEEELGRLETIGEAQRWLSAISAALKQSPQVKINWARFRGRMEAVVVQMLFERGPAISRTDDTFTDIARLLQSSEVAEQQEQFDQGEKLPNNYCTINHDEMVGETQGLSTDQILDRMENAKRQGFEWARVDLGKLFIWADLSVGDRGKWQTQLTDCQTKAIHASM